MNIAGKARVLALAAAAVGAPALYGQAIYGSLYGTVTDPTGAAIPNATVVVTDITKGTSDTVTTNGSGAYTVEHLIPDTYSIKVTAPGFAGYETTGVNVSADTSPKVDAKLNVGDAGQTVSVTADQLPTLTTDRAEVSTIFNQRNTQDLPLPGRNFTGLQLLLPGTQLLGWSHAASENPQGSSQIIVNGQHFAGVAYELDGTDNQDPILGIIVVNPSLEAVREAKIASQNYDAQFGKAVAAVVTAQTKSGENNVHGVVFDFRQSDANQAKNPFNKPDVVTGRVVPVGLASQFGGSIGGPIQKDRVFYFLDYQGLRSKVGTSTGINTVPTNLLQSSCAAGACNFSEYVGATFSNANDPTSFGAANGKNTAVIVNPVTGVPYGCPDVATFYATKGGCQTATIPTAQLNRPALALLARYPRPNTSTPNTSYQNYAAAGTGLFNSDIGTIRLDAQVSDKIHYFNRFSYFADTLTGGTAFGSIGGPGFGLGGYGGTSRGHNASWATGFDVVVTPKWLTDARFGYLRYSIATSKYDGSEAFATNNGIPGLNVSTYGNTGGAPEFDIDGPPNNGIGNPGANFGSGLGVNRCNCPLTENERQFQVVNNWTHEFGNHSLKFGVDFRHAYNLRVPSDQNRSGILSFQGKTTALGGNGGLGFASFVLGDVGQFARYASNTTTAAETQNRLFEYVQDTWRASPKLTINYGVRYENYFPEKVEKDNGAILNLNTGNLQVAHEGSYGGNMGIQNQWAAVAPRVGAAYQLGQKTVIRAGYGRSYDIGVFGSIFGHAVTQNLPVLAKQQNTTSGNAYVFQLGNSTPPPANFGAGQVNGNIRLPDGLNANARPTTERFPTLDAWNAQIQRDLGHQFNLTVGYVGNKGTHTFAGDGSTTNPNVVGVQLNGLAFNPRRNGVLVNPTLPQSEANDPARRRYYPLYGWTQDINYFSSHADTHFNALQVTLEKRMTKGIQFTVNYAHQVAKNYTDNYFEIDKRIGYGNQDDLRQDQLTVFGNIDLPFGRGKYLLTNANGIVERVVGGWTISPTANFATGLPFWANYKSAGNNKDSGPSQPNYSGSGFNTGLSGQDYNGTLSYFTPLTQDITQGGGGNGFTNPGFGKFGNLPRNSFFGPSYGLIDVRVTKGIAIRENINAQFTTDFFNALNHMNYANPGNTNIDVDGGQISGLAPSTPQDQTRTLQFGARVRF